MQDVDDIPRLKRKSLTEKISIAIDPETLEQYRFLKSHDYDPAECARRAVRDEIKRRFEQAKKRIG